MHLAPHTLAAPAIGRFATLCNFIFIPSVTFLGKIRKSIGRDDDIALAVVESRVRWGRERYHTIIAESGVLGTAKGRL
jgi:hypothetical protein